MTINQDIKNRQTWLNELWEYVKANSEDLEVAKIQYRRLLFEEK
jgi:hypothetical protein